MCVGRTAYVYRMFDEKRRLLYVGTGLSALARAGHHRRHKAWFDDVRRITITPYPSPMEAARAEVEAIGRERPLHNVHHNTSRNEARLRAKWVRNRANAPSSPSPDSCSGSGVADSRGSSTPRS
jgi:hypothetical protein